MKKMSQIYESVYLASDNLHAGEEFFGSDGEFTILRLTSTPMEKT